MVKTKIYSPCGEFLKRLKEEINYNSILIKFVQGF
jgi:hypothetical protein